MKAISGMKAVMIVAAGFAAMGSAQQPDDATLSAQPDGRDLYAARGEIRVRTPVDGDVVAAGRRIAIDGRVMGDIIAAGQEIDIRGEVDDDVRAAGQHIRIASPVSGHVVAAGQTVRVDRRVRDWAWLAGDSVEVHGPVGGELKVRARTVILNAEVAGDVDAMGEALELGPNAVVRGDLTWRSNTDAVVSPEAQIDGAILREPLPDQFQDFSADAGWFLPLSLIVAVMVLFVLLPKPVRATADQIATHPGRSLLIGLIVLCAVPPLALLLLVTGVGAWLAFTLLLLFFSAVLVGMLTGLFAVSDMALRRIRTQPVLWQSLAAIFLTVVAVSLIGKVPWLGPLSVVAILLAGVGALCWQIWAALQGGAGRPAQRSYAASP